MYKKSNFFIYIFVVHCQFYPNNSVGVCPINLKICMLYHMNNTFQNTAFYISVDVPLIKSVNSENYIFGDSNIHLYSNDSYILAKKIILNSRSVPSDNKSYHEFCTFFGLKQLIIALTRVTSIAVPQLLIIF